MYIKDFKSGHDDHDQQWSAGEFLILMQRKPLRDGLHSHEPAIRAIVRHVRMGQMGPWMMGTARVQHYTLGLSGSYGGDGMPTLVAPAVYAQGIDLPQDLYEAWNVGNGHNSAGSEAPLMRAWARENLDTLKAVRDVETPDELPNFSSPESLFQWSAVRNVNKAGVSFVTMRLEYVVESFRAGRPLYRIIHNYAKVGDVATVSMEQARYIRKAQDELQALCLAEMRKRGYGAGDNPEFVVPPADWVPFVLSQAGYSQAWVSA